MVSVLIVISNIQYINRILMVRSIGSYLACFAETVTGEDHVEGKLSHHWNVHFNEAVSCLLQQQSAAQVRVLQRKDHRSDTIPM